MDDSKATTNDIIFEPSIVFGDISLPLSILICKVYVETVFGFCQVVLSEQAMKQMRGANESPEFLMAPATFISAYIFISTIQILEWSKNC